MPFNLFKKPKVPNYLKTIKLILVAIVTFIIIVILITTTGTGSKLSSRENDIGYPDNIISKNLISYIKNGGATIPQINSDSPILGNKNASITIFEFSSFGCPYSAQIQPIIKNVLKKYPNNVKLVWKDLPLPDIYPNADLAHIAARCAQAQDRFWQYHDLLWGNQSADVIPAQVGIQERFNAKNIEAIARRAGLDLNKFKTCLNDDKIKTIIDNDITEANNLEISGTPHFYINSQELTGTVSTEDFDAVIAAELARQKNN